MMKTGLLTAILDGWTYEEVIDFAAEQEFYTLEVACWPQEKATRRYAGVSHIDAERIVADPAYKEYVLKYAADHGVTISALAYYPNPLDPDPEKSGKAIAHLHSLIDASAEMGIGMVTTFIGRDQHKTLEENLDLMMQVWPAILSHAEEKGVRIAIENCPMLFGADQWPGGQNLMCTPDIWRKVFALLDSDKLGLNFDPSHFVWQQLDYVRAVYEFRNRIFHIHFKDIKLYPDKLAEYGVLAYPLSYMSPKIPGHGDVDWGAFISALQDIGYTGPAVIEVEDKAYESCREDIVESVLQSRNYLKQFIAF